MSIESRDRRQRRLVYASFVLLATIMHLFLVLSTLGARTSCAWPPCHESWAFDAWRWLLDVPLFVTPWFELPIEDEHFAWTRRRVAAVVANSALAVPLGMLLGRGAGFLFRQIAAGISRSRASSACSAVRGK